MGAGTRPFNTILTYMHYAMLALLFTTFLPFALVYGTVIYVVSTTRRAVALLMNVSEG